MKKIILIMVFALATFSMNANATSSDELYTSCWDYAINAVSAELEHYGLMTSEEFSEAFDFYYEGCQEYGEDNVGPPVFL